jgi:hypothetical protein
MFTSGCPQASAAGSVSWIQIRAEEEYLEKQRGKIIFSR